MVEVKTVGITRYDVEVEGFDVRPVYDDGIYEPGEIVIVEVCLLEKLQG